MQYKWQVSYGDSTARVEEIEADLLAVGESGALVFYRKGTPKFLVIRVIARTAYLEAKPVK